ncbi:MAG: hypothetical protein ACD_42C00211G0001 [uncultured bacterium]|nr:MAG: hypothetical protein ACD_42C00211G0001 [uncultured bacterium]OGT26641.1 MAG: hypothetical protein A3B71_03205 [Gammaproteobacteria bacterium RIFCSPHIGHO2_02_FULL_42_43]OGT28336.1 MAG: hypothetical protein A2624_04265 [Gammaproteobacteria bacterium RIFCSPHIGHO2_01_FULL_42_8]OGT53053.1 MAG: hypothetical protein A3E54_08325 [Gammaproteobacteria bacterium RIFCSPHIGHO2_12_FULL_41_25]OGT61173.1 MAG: hypothetical protein A3I77_07370 [Gammaproteobacteria bacterium RIFCSPLOWO2_02_FULL_42_14]OGT
MPRRVLVDLEDKDDKPPSRCFFLTERNVEIITWYAQTLIWLMSDCKLKVNEKYDMVLPMVLGMCHRLTEMQWDVPQHDDEAHQLLTYTINVLPPFSYENPGNHIGRLQTMFFVFPKQPVESNNPSENTHHDTLTRMLVSSLQSFFWGVQRRHKTAAFNNRGGVTTLAQTHALPPLPLPSYMSTPPSSTPPSTPVSTSFASESSDNMRQSWPQPIG